MRQINGVGERKYIEWSKRKRTDERRKEDTHNGVMNDDGIGKFIKF